MTFYNFPKGCPFGYTGHAVCTKRQPFGRIVL